MRVSGTLNTDHGDYLVLEDGGEALFLIRDERLRGEVVALQGQSLNLIVEPVHACNAEAGSSMTACIWLGSNGTAYRIIEWCVP